MAKKSIEARQRKRAKIVAKYADKRAALKAAGDYAGLDLLPKKNLNALLSKKLKKEMKWSSSILMCLDTAVQRPSDFQSS